MRQQDALLARCESEPIHIPGAIQSHGGLIAFAPRDGRIAYRSANLAALLDLTADPLGATIGEVLGEQAGEQIANAADTPAEHLIPATFRMPSGRVMYATAHRGDGLVVVELEGVAAESDEPLLHEARRAVERVEATSSVSEACVAAVEEVRRLTGYARVMAYRFHEDGHGEVVAEARRDDVEAYLGLHYPASDIPRPARRLLRLSPVRLIADVNATDVAITGHAAFRERPLDLSRSALRAVSPIHLQYLRNMGVAASLTISLVDGPQLWGLLACHHDEAMLPTPAVRSACAIVARTLWQKIEAHEQLEQHEEQRKRLSLRAHFLATVSSSEALAVSLVEDGHSLLELLAADGVAVHIDGSATRLGATPPREQIAALVEHLRVKADGDTFVTNESGALLPEFALDNGTAAGLLAIAVSPAWQEYVIWFRGEVERTVTWAGDPAKPATPTPGAAGGHDLSPRTSFAAWRETMRGRSAAWTPSDLSVAAEFVASLPAVRAVRARDALAKLALRDSLTGLPNRQLLLDRLAVALSALQRGGGTVTILFLDLDGFKAVNDGLGHQAGDELLIEVAARLSGEVRSSETVARLGGDEFVIVCRKDASAKEIDQLVARLLDSLSQPIAVAHETCTVTASIGIATLEKTAKPADALRAADAAMYRAKRLGRNRAAR